MLDLQVNKDRATQVLNFMKQINNEWISNGIQSDFALDTDERARYSFRKFLHDNKLLINPMEKNGDLWIECPFHDDVSPSCSINEQKYVYHCFSCGSSGNLINLIKEYKNKFEEAGVGYYQILNSFLQKDSIMQATLGFNNIFCSNKQEDDINWQEEIELFKFKKPVSSIKPTSYSELSSLMIKNNASLEQIKLFILLMQAHLSPEEINNEVFSIQKTVSNTESISLNDMLSFD